MTIFKPCNFNYDQLLSGDVFFTNSVNPIGAVIRLGEKFVASSIGNRAIPNHAGLIMDIYDQKFAAEIGWSGLNLNSLEQYRGKYSQIITVLRWPEMDIGKFNTYMSQRVRKHQDKGYDFIGAIRSSPIIKKLFPKLKGDSKKEFCSEDVYSVLKNIGMYFPLTWEKNPPNPLDLYNWLVEHHWFHVQGWKQ